MKKYLSIVLLLLVFNNQLFSQIDTLVREKDRKKDILFETTMGNIYCRLSDSTPIHRDNFIKLVKMGFYDSLLFHRVINHFVIQTGDPTSKDAAKGKPLGDNDRGYWLPSEFRFSLFHKYGAIQSARWSDDVNPNKMSSSSQFCFVQGKIFNDQQLDSIETNRLKRPIPKEYREVYKTIGGVPHLDQNYTVFGIVIKGMDVVEKIAAVATSKGEDMDRPLEDVRIIKARLIKRKKHY